MSFYETYKPLRNMLRRFGVRDSLNAVWLLSLYAHDQRPLPPGFFYSLPRVPSKLLPWHVEILAKEIILNAEEKGERTLREWRRVAQAINLVHQVSNKSYGAGDGDEMDVMIEMLRIVHQQFPTQRRNVMNQFMRTAMVFGDSKVDFLVQRRLGMTTKQLVTLSAALSGHFLTRGIFNRQWDYSVLGVGRDALHTFMSRMTKPLAVLRTEAKDAQKYDRDWTYSWNPLVGTPFVELDPAEPHLICCPIPYFLERRTTAGLYFDLVNEREFSEGIGDSFNNYIGGVLKKAAPGTTILREQPFTYRGETNHGADWIWSDASAHLFIECKTKRLRVGGRSRSDGVELRKDLQVLAEAVVQTYRNMMLGIAGHLPHWSPDGLPVFPLVVTLDDWYLIGTTAAEWLLESVKSQLVEKGFDPALTDRYPFLIASAEELEFAARVFTRKGLAKVMQKKTSESFFRHFGLLNFLHAEYSDDLRSGSSHLFREEFEEFISAAKRSPATT